MSKDRKDKNGHNNSLPNILFIYSDEHDAGVTGCYGDPVIKTPHLDQLAGQGILFEAAYTPSPLCAPARHALTVGRYVSRIGTWRNESYIHDNDVPSIASLMKNAGYDVALSGKMHYKQGYSYGFEMLDPQSQNRQRATEAGRFFRPRPADCLEVDIKSWKGRSAAFYTAEKSGYMEHDRAVTRRCSQFFCERQAGDKPFFLMAGYITPHFPLVVPVRFWKRYRGRVPMPEIPEGYLDNMPRNYQHLRRGFGVTEATEGEVRLGRELYWGLTEWFDGQVGELLSALEAAGLAENTVVVYSSDHGENKGDHGLWWKNSMFEHSARVPLIVRWPGVLAGGQRRTEVCSILDLMKTFLEIGGACPTREMDGDSMLAWWLDPEVDWKDRAVSEYYGHNTCSGMTMIRRGPWKYIYHASAGEGFPPERELYHIPTDPRELTNLAANAEHASLLDALHGELTAELGLDPEVMHSQAQGLA